MIHTVIFEKHGYEYQVKGVIGAAKPHSLGITVSALDESEMENMLRLLRKLGINTEVIVAPTSLRGGCDY